MQEAWPDWDSIEVVASIPFIVLKGAKHAGQVGTGKRLLCAVSNRRLDSNTELFDKYKF